MFLMTIYEELNKFTHRRIFDNLVAGGKERIYFRFVLIDNIEAIRYTENFVGTR